MTRENRTSSSAHVTFRVTNPAVAALLGQRANAAGRSPSVVARELVTEALTCPDVLAHQIAQIQSRLDAIVAKLAMLDKLQRQLQRGVFVLLKSAGRLDSMQAAAAVERLFSDSHPAPDDQAHAFDQEDGAWE